MVEFLLIQAKEYAVTSQCNLGKINSLIPFLIPFAHRWSIYIYIDTIWYNSESTCVLPSPVDHFSIPEWLGLHWIPCIFLDNGISALKLEHVVTSHIKFLNLWSMLLLLDACMKSCSITYWPWKPIFTTWFNRSTSQWENMCGRLAWPWWGSKQAAPRLCTMPNHCIDQNGDFPTSHVYIYIYMINRYNHILHMLLGPRGSES